MFAYGQTGTGKTYTMEGQRGDPAQRGVIPNAIEVGNQQNFKNIFGFSAHFPTHCPRPSQPTIPGPRIIPGDLPGGDPGSAQPKCQQKAGAEGTAGCGGVREGAELICHQKVRDSGPKAKFPNVEVPMDSPEIR